LAQITSRERIEQRLWNQVALREAVINAIVHNDYTSEVPPKFEFFDDRIEITSFGSLPQGMTESEFFEGYSIPRNKELMRVFRDLDLVEHLGSGIPRILQHYGKECFTFFPNFLRMTFPAVLELSTQDNTQVNTQDNAQVDAQVDAQVSTQDNTQVSTQVEHLLLCLNLDEKSTLEIANLLNLKDRIGVMRNYIQPALKQGLIEMTIPDKPNSRLQKYRLTVLGKQLKEKMK
jgi:predicted HTH transcriptional regulator